MDFVNSLPALEEKGLNVSYVKVRLKDLLGKLDGDYAKELEAIKKFWKRRWITATRKTVICILPPGALSYRTLSR